MKISTHLYNFCSNEHRRARAPAPRRKAPCSASRLTTNGALLRYQHPRPLPWRGRMVYVREQETWGHGAVCARVRILTLLRPRPSLHSEFCSRVQGRQGSVPVGAVNPAETVPAIHGLHCRCATESLAAARTKTKFLQGNRTRASNRGGPEEDQRSEHSQLQ